LFKVDNLNNLYDWSIASFLSIAPYLFFTLFIHILCIYLLSNKSSYDYFELNKRILPHEIGIIGSIAFWIMYLDVIYNLLSS